MILVGGHVKFIVTTGATYLDTALVFQRDGQPVQGADGLLVLGKVLVEILGPREGKVGIERV